MAKKTTAKSARSSNGTTKKTSRSSASKVTKKTTRSKATSESKATKAAEPKKVKSPLTKRELLEYKKLLLLKRVEILGDMDSITREALSDTTNLSHMPIHMADVGSDQHEQELMLGLVESERQLVHEINEALERIEEGTYGICHATGQPIGKPRLQAKPWAKYCIEAAREMERNGGNRRF